MNKLFNLILAFLAALTLVACGGGGGNAPPLVATADTTLAVSPTITAAVVNTSFAFPSGVSEFGTVAPTTLAFTSTSTTPSFSIASGGNSASGTTSFGSCDFLVTQSTFVAPSPLARGNTVIVNPCNIRVSTAGQTANGVAQSRSVVLLLGAAASSGVLVTVSISPGGQVTLNGIVVGTVTLAPVTGGG